MAALAARLFDVPVATVTIVDEDRIWFKAAHGLNGVSEIGRELARRLRTDVLFRASIRLTVERGTFQANDSDLYDWWLRAFARELARAQGAGELRPEVAPDDVAASVVGSFTGIQMLSHVTCDRRDLHERLARWSEQILPGIATPDAIRTMLPAGSPGLDLPEGA
ncbi:hypothetical protein [Streptomyces sp. NPDC029554]|uniref:hypothetical protein n=1 Tax=Streptomyces sp. NPDC029554 TaxID=3155126 RepID=UPI0033DE111D